VQPPKEKCRHAQGKRGGSCLFSLRAALWSLALDRPWSPPGQVARPRRRRRKLCSPPRAVYPCAKALGNALMTVTCACRGRRPLRAWSAPERAETCLPRGRRSGEAREGRCASSQNPGVASRRPADDLNAPDPGLHRLAIKHSHQRSASRTNPLFDRTALKRTRANPFLPLSFSPPTPLFSSSEPRDRSSAFCCRRAPGPRPRRPGSPSQRVLGTHARHVPH